MTVSPATPGAARSPAEDGSEARTPSSGATALPGPAACWGAVVERDPGFDGRFVFAVSTTGVYCRPSCRSRRALRKHVSFFGGPEAAEAAGYRACKRCRPDRFAAGGPGDAPGGDAHASRIAAWCSWIRERVERGESVTLEALGRRAGRSAGYVQRTFRAVMGVSPRRYAEGLRLESFKGALRRAGSVTAAIYEAGFGSSSRVYDGGDARMGMTPRAYRRGGEGARVSFTVLDLPELEGIGLLLVGATDRGLCSVALGASRAELEARLRRELPRATIDEVRPPYSRPLAEWIAGLRERLRGRAPRRALPLDVRATALRLAVWGYLRSIPSGEVRTYSEVAAAIGHRRAVRAVASACAANPVALVIPCHRVLRADGGLGGYRWGLERKRKLLEAERQGSAQDGGAPGIAGAKPAAPFYGNPSGPAWTETPGVPSGSTAGRDHPGGGRWRSRGSSSSRTKPSSPSRSAAASSSRGTR